MADNVEFGKRLGKFISDAGLNKKRVADAIGISPAAIGTYIKDGRIPEAPILFNISRLLNKTMEELLTGESPIPLERGVIVEVHGEIEHDFVIKLLRIIRTKDEETIKAITQNIDQFLRVPDKEEAALAAEEKTPKRKRRAVG